MDYLEQLKFPLKCKDRLLASVRRFDFSTTEACLVASVPGTHRERERKVGKYGHMALRRHLEKQTFDERFKNSPLVYQFSSMGSLSEKWLREEFTESCSAGLYLEKDGGPRRKLAKPKDLSKDIHLIWPTVDEVRLSSEGYGAGASLPGMHTQREKREKRDQCVSVCLSVCVCVCVIYSNGDCGFFEISSS